ncbi:MAG: polysaccharide deacetylase family protein [Phycisphaerae bacterium]|nr:polysaccharide deacetylase family protein [Phycisphaerae bacterium]
MKTLLARTEFNTWTGQWVRRLRRRRNDCCINIVAYHSVARRESVFTAGTSLRHDPAVIERQIEYLAEHYSPIGLSELVRLLAGGERPHRAVVVTFDDGFGDSIRQAREILYRRRIPMTVFPVTSVIGNTDLMWQHKLAWLIANGHEGKVGDAFEAEGFPPRGAGEPLADYARRHYRAEIPDILEDVLRATGRSGARLAAAMRPYLEAEEVAEADPTFVEFGNHTHTHAVLSALTAEQQDREITTARDMLVSLTGRLPIAAAYPFGLKRHYNADSKRIVRETGHRAALDMRRRINAGRVDAFELSRKPAPCGSQIVFEKMMEDWPANARNPSTRARSPCRGVANLPGGGR